MDNFRTQLSVIICSHNPRVDYLRRTLEALKTQTLPLEQWELLLVDNASGERLKSTCDISWHPSARHVREERIGLTAARLRGIKESGGELLVFVDDDNVLAADFLEQAVAIATRHHDLGAFRAGKLEPEFEIQPPHNLVPLLPMLALRNVAAARWTNNIRDYSCVPWGAGLCVTRKIALGYVELVQSLAMNEVIDRRGQQLCCGGDDLFSWVSARAGASFGLFPELRINHLILADRLRRGYFLRLSGAVIEITRDRNSPLLLERDFK